MSQSNKGETGLTSDSSQRRRPDPKEGSKDAKESQDAFHAFYTQLLPSPTPQSSSGAKADTKSSDDVPPKADSPNDSTQQAKLIPIPPKTGHFRAVQGRFRKKTSVCSLHSGKADISKRQRQIMSSERRARIMEVIDSMPDARKRRSVRFGLPLNAARSSINCVPMDLTELFYTMEARTNLLSA